MQGMQSRMGRVLFHPVSHYNENQTVHAHKTSWILQSLEENAVILANILRKYRDFVVVVDMKTNYYYLFFRFREHEDIFLNKNNMHFPPVNIDSASSIYWKIQEKKSCNTKVVRVSMT